MRACLGMTRLVTFKDACECEETSVLDTRYSVDRHIGSEWDAIDHRAIGTNARIYLAPILEPLTICNVCINHICIIISRWSLFEACLRVVESECYCCNYYMYGARACRVSYNCSCTKFTVTAQRSVIERKKSDLKGAAYNYKKKMKCLHYFWIRTKWFSSVSLKSYFK